MPILRLPDGSVVNFPDTMSPQEIKAAVEKASANASKREPTGMARVQQGARQLGRATALKGRALAEGAAGLVGIAYDPARAALGMIPGVGQEKPLKTMVGETLTRAGVPTPATPIERVTGAATEMLIPAAGQIGIARQGLNVLGQAPQAVSAGRNVLTSLAAQPSQQLAGAAGAGAAAETAREMGGNALTQFGAGLLGGVAGARAAGTRYEAPTAALPQAVQEAQKRGINVFTTDVMPPRGFVGGTVRRAGEAIPFVGMSGPRAAQETQRVNAVRQTLEDFGVNPGGLTDETLGAITKDLGEKRSANLERLTDIKKNIIERLSDPASNPSPVATPRAQEEIARQLAAFIDADPVIFKPVINYLKNAQTALTGKTLTSIEKLRAAYRNAFADPKLGSVRPQGDAAMDKVYKALRQDMGAYIGARSGQQVRAQWQQTDATLADMYNDTKVSTFKQVLNNADLVPEQVKNLLFSQETSKLQLLAKGLTAQGRRNAQQAILQRAMQKGGDITEPGRFNATAFENELGRLERQLGVFFQGADGQAVEGLRRALRLTGQATAARQAGQAPTGQQALLAAITGVLTSLAGGNLAVSAALLGGTGGAIRLFESGPVRDALLRLGRATTQQEQNEAVKRLISATQATQPSEQEVSDLSSMSDEQLNAALRRLGY
jgi:hypothetical protein